MKVCSNCKTSKSFEEYSKGHRWKDGMKPWCKPCAVDRQREYLTNPEKKARKNELQRQKYDFRKDKNKHLRRKYGITIETYEAMWASQKGLCKVCEKPPKNKDLAVDHCHKTGRIRGLLCCLCNTAIGRLGDSVEGIERVIKYLRGA